MPSKLVNNTLSALSSGVTQQYQEGRFDSQVTEMINCIPTLTRGVLRRNPLRGDTTYITGDSRDLSSSFIYTYDRGTEGEQYIVVIPGDGTMIVRNIVTGDITNIPYNTYLVAPVGTLARNIFKAMTLGDHTFIVNSTITVQFTNDLTSTSKYSDAAFYWIKKTIGVVTEQEQTGTGTITTGSKLVGYTYTVNGYSVQGLEDTRPSTVPKIDRNTSKAIAANIAANSGTTKLPGVLDSVAYSTNYTSGDFTWSDTFGEEASLGVWKSVDSADKLPTRLPAALDGFKVRVAGGTSDEFDDYFLQYDYTIKSWKEIPAPNVKYKLDATTMPHVLYRLTSGFTFNTYQEISSDGSSLTGTSKWGERSTGGEDTLDDPSFVGASLLNIFFHKNRLGFITKDNIILSMSGDYGNFFIQTLQNVLDDDPIDLAVASTDVTVLRHAVPTAGELIIFADDTQFSLTSLEGTLTPNSANISPISNYTYNDKIEAKAIGNKVYFANTAGNYTQLYSYQISDRGSQITEANQLTLHLPTYMSSTIDKIVGHDVLGYVFMTDIYNKKILTVLNTVTKQNTEIQNAFHKWEFDRDIITAFIMNNLLYIIFNEGQLTYMDLNTPPDITVIDYKDYYSDVDVLGTDYVSSIVFSQFFLRGADGKGTVRGRYQLRTLEYTVEDYSKFVTNIYNKDSNLFDTTTMYGTTWEDTDTWDDTKIWVEVNPLYSREYVDDSKITVMSDSKKVIITFKSSELEPNKGFELATVNIEALFHQRSART